jgi:hypothetical protein
MAAAMEVLVRRRDEASPAARHAIDLLDADLRRFRRLVGDLLEISRVDQGAFRLSAERLDLAELTRNVLVRSSTGGSVPVEASGPVPVLGDRRRLEQVVSNLVDNAEGHGRGLVRVAVCHAERVVRLEVDERRPGRAGGRPRADLRAVRQGVRPGPAGRGHRQRSRAGAGRAARPAALGRVWVTDRPGGGPASWSSWAAPDEPATSGRPAGRRGGCRRGRRVRGQGTGPAGDPPVAPRSSDGNADRDRTSDGVPVLDSAPSRTS